MKRKLLVIDGQVFQTDARDRGMGRYSACLIKSLLAQKHYSKVQVIVSKKLNINRLDNNDLVKFFKGMDIVHLNLADTTKTKIEAATYHNKRELNDYIASIKSEDYDIDYLIPSPFQEPVVSVFPEGVKRVLVFYDLIPYLYHHRYQSLMQFDNYLKRFSLLLEADKILTISRSVRDDLMVYLGIPGDRVVSIDGAAIKSNKRLLKPRAINIPEDYILMPTSDDSRKNNLRAVLGFEEFRAGRSDDFKLVITSKIHKNERNKLNAFSDNLLFTGNIEDYELDWLYSRCQAVLFVSESEGLGLPVLEAVLTDKRMICSSLNVFKEISEDAFYYCDYEDQHSIASAITRALATSDRSVPKAKYRSILKHYSWDQTAKRSVRAMDGIVLKGAVERPKIAVFTPAPDGLSAVGKVVAESHPALSEYFDIDYYAEPGQNLIPTRPNYLQYIANYFPAESFGVEKYAQYDAVVYHVGNSDYHVESIRNSLYLPGYAILHDTNISEAYRIMDEKGMISSERRSLEGVLSSKSSSTMSQCIASVVNNQLGIMTHSKYAAKAVKDVLVTSVPIQPVNLATYCPTMVRQRDYARLTIGLAGIIADVKGIKVIESLANNSVFGDCEIKLFGYNYTSKETMDRLRAYANVSVSTNLSDFDFQTSINKLDVFVNYRMKYQGETSLSTIEAMRQGVVVIVRNVGWYSELPDNAVIKVESEKEVTDILNQLKSDPDRLARISSEAIQYINSNYSYKQYAEGLIKLMGTPKPVSGIDVSSGLKSGNVKSSADLLRLYKQSLDSEEGL